MPILLADEVFRIGDLTEKPHRIQLDEVSRAYVPRAALAQLRIERPDLEALLTVEEIAVVWRQPTGGFTDNANGAFT